MAFTKITLQKLAAITKLKEDDIAAAAKDEKEVDLAIPEGEVFTAEELSKRDENSKQEGISQGKELGAKEVRKAAGLAEGTSKDPARIAQAIAEKAVADAKIKPDEKVTQLTEQVALLQKSIGEKNAEIVEHKATAHTIKQDRKLLAAFPQNRTEVLSDDEYLSIIKSTYVFEEKDGVMTVKKDGNILRDSKTQNPVALKDAITNIFAERKGWLTTAEGNNPPAGRGNGDQQNPGGGFTKKSQVIKHFEDQGISLTGEGSQKITAELDRLSKADPSFDMAN